MIKLFLSYRFTGEEPNALREVLNNIKKILMTGEDKVFCSFFLEKYFNEEKMDSDQIYDYCLKEQENCDCFIALIKSNDKSKGMELELDNAIKLGQKIILLIHEDLEFPKFGNISNEIIEYKSFPQLYEKLKTFNSPSFSTPD